MDSWKAFSNRYNSARAASANAPERVKVRFPIAPSPANFFDILIGEQCSNSASKARKVAPLSQLGSTPAWKWAITWFANAISACVHCPVRRGTSLEATFAWGRLREDMVVLARLG